MLFQKIHSTNNKDFHQVSLAQVKTLYEIQRVAGSSDVWDETNITCCGFGPKGIMGFGPKLFGIQKKKKK